MTNQLSLIRTPVCALGLMTAIAHSNAGEVRRIDAKTTLTAVEMDLRDELQFKLRSGRAVHLVLEGTDAAIVERVDPGGIVYRFSCRLRVDGQPINLQRYVCSQECFYEPFVVDGLRIWPDIVKKVFDLVPVRYPRKGNLQCVPRKAARLALHDATLRICPDQAHPWLDEEENFLDVGRCYNGDDCYLGPYLGSACHVGLDVNHSKGSLLFAPIKFDTHAYFNSLAMGDNNNRWRGIRRWPNGDVWALQTHHLIELTVPPNELLSAGAKYATTAGVHVGSHEHTHFEFKIGRKNTKRPLRASDEADSIACPIDFDDQSESAQQDPEVLHLDPWIVFWQIYEDRKTRRGEICAAMQPLKPANTGDAVRFSADGSRAGPSGGDLACYWTFGDGGFAIGRQAKHTFAAPGVYPVTLTVDDGRSRARSTQHIVVRGELLGTPSLALEAPEEPSFRPRPCGGSDIYGRPVGLLPHTLAFVARRSRLKPEAKLIGATDSSSRASLDPLAVQVNVEGGAEWLSFEPATVGGKHFLRVSVDAAGREPGVYTSTVAIACRGAINSPQRFRVEMDVRDTPPPSRLVVDNDDAACYATPSYWVGHRFSRCPLERRGHRGSYLTDGGRAEPGEFVRFTPDLLAGNYEISFSSATPFPPGAEFDARVRHRDGLTTVRVRPSDSRRLGVFPFAAGAEGFVEIRSGGSRNMVVADAVVFERRN